MRYCTNCQQREATHGNLCDRCEREKRLEKQPSYIDRHEDGYNKRMEREKKHKEKRRNKDE